LTRRRRPGREASPRTARLWYALMFTPAQAVLDAVPPGRMGRRAPSAPEPGPGSAEEPAEIPDAPAPPEREEPK
jgi:hypothetical protein